MIPRDTYERSRAARRSTRCPSTAGSELGADGRAGRQRRRRREGRHVQVSVRLISVAAARRRWRANTAARQANPRFYAHTIADEIHQQRALTRRRAHQARLLLRSRRRAVRSAIEKRDRRTGLHGRLRRREPARVTVTKSLEHLAGLVARRRSIAYTSSWRGLPGHLRVATSTGGTLAEPDQGHASKQNYLPAWSPDGTQLAFTSNRDGNPEIYVMNRDGSGLRRLTNHPDIDVTPTWSPTGTQIAFTSDRTGTPQIYIVGADGTRAAPITRESLRPADLVAGAVQRDRLFARAAAATTSRSSTSPRARRGKSPTARAATRARLSRRTAGTSRSRRPAPARTRSSRSTATARACGRSRATATTAIRLVEVEDRERR